MNPVEISRSESFEKLSKYLLKGKSNLPSPAKSLDDISHQNSVFTRQDIARYLNKTIDDSESMSYAIDRILASDNVVTLRSRDASDEKLYYSTWEMVSIEKNLMEATERMAGVDTHAVNSWHVDQALIHANSALIKQAGVELSEEQHKAVRHVTDANELSIVSGLAGAGKSTMLGAAREAWEAQGYSVHGAALAGKAAEGLQESSNITSRTLASYELGWKNGYGELTANDILVIDEAGMVGSKQLSRFVNAAEKSGAKLVLVGDAEQLQAIGAGAPFRKSVDTLNAAKLENVVRQRDDWQREATLNLSTNRTAVALEAYRQNGDIYALEDSEACIKSLTDDYLTDSAKHPDKSRVALAHRNIDVKAINQLVRNTRLANRDISQGVDFQTDEGKQAFSVGDRLIFLENDRDLNVKNGMLSTVVDIRNGVLVTQLDGSDKRLVEVKESNYSAIDYGYASTIHKSQSMTVDHSFVMASYTMDRHMSYVAMSRHRDTAKLYYNQEQFNCFEAMANRLGRAGLKRSTLDYDIDMSKSMKSSIQTEPENVKVGWTQTYNLGNTSDHNACKIMAATAESAADIKKAVAESKGEKFKNSKKCTKPVYHFCVTWPEEDAPSENLQRLAVNEAIEVLDLGRHEALAVQHLDGNPHVHVMLNLIDPETGMSASTSVEQAREKMVDGKMKKVKASKLSNSHKKFRQWANRFEIEHGLQITEGSIINEERRQAGEKVDARRKSRAVYNREQREGFLVDFSRFAYSESVVSRSDHQQSTHEKFYTASDIGEIGKRLKRKHELQYVKLNTAYKDRMQGLYREKEAAIIFHEKKFSASYKVQRDALYKSQQHREREFIKAERRSLDTLINSVGTFFTSMRERKSALKAIYAATSSVERREVLMRWDKGERDALYKKEKTECAAYIDKNVIKAFDEEVDEVQKEYLSEDTQLRYSHGEQNRKVQKRWANYSSARSASAEQCAQQRSDVAKEQSVNESFGLSAGFHLSPD